ncbi:hypothetical protein [Phenylobacterium sp.]|uniref:hypothetical protein n=1 Tax=Phenylobacterium sp. TaxID=1871053 RepID=UPI0025D46A66|nr:hypothetical protein [Phenylobacterium sp.]
MSQPTEHVTESGSPSYEDLPPVALSPLDPQEAYDLHRAINERRAQVENPELLRRLRSL